uniref:SMP-LTD domain-containing protein n=1 Tax=Coturnix japonica TaxID=93934 RepID=A0A8C2SZ00_COTJA
MNQLHSYDHELYHPSLTHSVLATLDGATLKLSYPKSNIPRQATFAEEILDVAFVSHRCYDMSGAKVSLCPPGLARKRLWNKKYPICILFPEQTDTEHGSSNEHGTELPGDEGTRKPQAPGQDVPGDCRERCLYLFGRTGREKEEWYHHLLASWHVILHTSPLAAARPVHVPMSPGKEPAAQSSASSISGSTEDIPSAIRSKELVGIFQQKIFLDYSTYMAQFVPAETGSSPEQSPPHSTLGSPAATKVRPETGCSEGCVAWVNALVGRIFWDFLRERYWAEQVSCKIQKKLSKIKLPYFMNELKLTELDMGTSIPSILSASKPTINDRGLWVDMEVTYSGSLQMTLETKMNLCKLGKDGAAEDSGQVETKPRLILLADSDAESSSAGSSDEEDIVTAESMLRGTGGNSTGRKILRFVDKIAKSKYFQKATENEFIKKKIEEVSNTPLLLMVEVQELAGTLTVNVPPPPTDRVWYSFRVPPQLELKVCPKLGEREVTFVHVTEWIEKKLKHEFQKILVMPNMDDLIIPIILSSASTGCLL